MQISRVCFPCCFTWFKLLDWRKQYQLNQNKQSKTKTHNLATKQSVLRSLLSKDFLEISQTILLTERDRKKNTITSVSVFPF